jgi:hypothetical protein
MPQRADDLFQTIAQVAAIVCLLGIFVVLRYVFWNLAG